MAYSRFINGFDITSNAAVDKRLILTKAEMLTADDVYNMPDNYICICKDDGRLYIWNATYSLDPVIGKFRPYEEVIDLPAALVSAMQSSPEAMEAAVAQTLPGALADALASQADKDTGLTVDDDGNIKVNLNNEHLAIIDNEINLVISTIQAIDGNDN